VQSHSYGARTIVQRGEGRDGAGLDGEVFAQAGGRGEGEGTDTQRSGEGLEVDGVVFGQGDQPGGALTVAEEEVFDVEGGVVGGAHGAGLGDGKHRVVVVRRVGDAEGVEAREEREGRVVEGEAVPGHAVAVEDEAAVEAVAREHLRHPEHVVGPHLRVGDGVEGRPQGHGLVGLDGFALAAVGGEDVAMQRVSVDKLEAQLAPVAGGR
jgi:hypothetical protein